MRPECSGAHELRRLLGQVGANRSCCTSAHLVPHVSSARRQGRRHRDWSADNLTKLVTAWAAPGPAARARQRRGAAFAERREAAERERAAAAARAERERAAAAARAAAEAAARRGNGKRRWRSCGANRRRRRPRTLRSTRPPSRAQSPAGSPRKAAASLRRTRSSTEAAARGLVIPEKGALKLLQPMAAAAGLRISDHRLRTSSRPWRQPGAKRARRSCGCLARALRGWIASQKDGRIEANELADFYKSPAARGPVTKEAITYNGGPLKLLRPVAAKEGLRIVIYSGTAQPSIEVIEPTARAAPRDTPAAALEGKGGEDASRSTLSRHGATTSRSTSSPY